MSGKVLNFTGGSGSGGGSGSTVTNPLTRIEVTTPPTKVEYEEGESLNTRGMVVNGYFSDGTVAVIIGYNYSPAEFTLGDTEVTITYPCQDAVLSATIPVTVVESAPANIYGITKEEYVASPRWSRTDKAAGFVDPVPYVNGATSYSSPFDNLMPWKGMVKVTDPVAGELVAIPKFWYKWSKSGSYITLKIADKYVSGFNVSPAHMDRGDGCGERDVVYVGRHLCSSAYSSKTGVAPVTNITRANARNGISAMGEEYCQVDFALLWTIRMLYLVEYANWNSQAVIGAGCGTVSNTGLTDDMPYHTGTVCNDRTTFGAGMQYRYIEDLWANARWFVDGVAFGHKGMSVFIRPSKFSDDPSGGTMLGDMQISDSLEFIATMHTIPTNNGYEWALYPSSAGRYTTAEFTADGYIKNATSGRPVMVVGGHGTSQYYGLFSFTENTASGTGSNISCRLMKLPNPTT